MDIPAQLNVDLVHCERIAAELVAQDSAVQLAQGELLSTQYFDALAVEVQEVLAEAGAMSIGMHTCLCGRNHKQLSMWYR